MPDKKEILVHLKEIFPRMSQRDLISEDDYGVMFFLPGTAEEKASKPLTEVSLGALAKLAKALGTEDIKIIFGIYHVKVQVSFAKPKNRCPHNFIPHGEILGCVQCTVGNIPGVMCHAFAIVKETTSDTSSNQNQTTT